MTHKHDPYLMPWYDKQSQPCTHSGGCGDCGPHAECYDGRCVCEYGYIREYDECVKAGKSCWDNGRY